MKRGVQEQSPGEKAMVPVGRHIIHILVSRSETYCVLVTNVYVLDSDLNVPDHMGNQLLHKPWILAGLLV